MNRTLPDAVKPYRHDPLSRSAIQEELLTMVALLIKGKDDLWRQKIALRLSEVFSQWKIERGSRSPMTRRGVKGFRTHRPIEFDAATPYECVEPESGVSDYVTLFLHLAKANYPPIVELLEIEDIQELVAIAALMEPDTVQLRSLLVEIRIALSLVTRREAHWQNILSEAVPIFKAQALAVEVRSRGRQNAAKKKQLDANKLHGMWREEAEKFLMKDPNATLGDAANHIRVHHDPSKKKRSFATVRDAIAGCDVEARKRLALAASVNQA